MATTDPPTTAVVTSSLPTTIAATSNVWTTSIPPPTSAITAIQTTVGSISTLVTTNQITLTSTILPTATLTNTSIPLPDTGDSSLDTIKLGLIIGACAIFLAGLGIFAFRTINLRASDKFKSRLNDSMQSFEDDSSPFPARKPLPNDQYPSNVREHESFFSPDGTPRPSVDYGRNSPYAYTSAIPQTIFDYSKYPHKNVYANDSQMPSYDYSSLKAANTSGPNDYNSQPGYPKYGGIGTSVSSAPNPAAVYSNYNSSPSSCPPEMNYSNGPTSQSSFPSPQNYSNNNPTASAPNTGISPNDQYFPAASGVTPRSSFTYSGVPVPINNPAYNWKASDPTQKYYQRVGNNPLYVIPQRNTAPTDTEDNITAEIPLLDESDKPEIPILDESHMPKRLLMSQVDTAEDSAPAIPLLDDRNSRQETLDMPPIIDSKNNNSSL
ncbi:hypothetical protein HDV01_004601 [Terramyces sp. JEL0728]|nr:hypothetical protein HDV01_004601 [Terramyces sp. JEL0728]